MGAKEEGSDLQDLPDDQDVVSNHPSEGEILTPSQRRRGKEERLGKSLNFNTKEKQDSSGSFNSRNRSIQNEDENELESLQDHQDESNYKNQNPTNQSPDRKPSGSIGKKLILHMKGQNERNRADTTDSAQMLFGSAAGADDLQRD